MKKRLITILSLVMAVVLCFSLAACGGDKSKQPSPYKTVSISLDDALGAMDGVMNAQGMKGTASYTLSTKNTEAITESYAYDKRGSKIKLTSGEDEKIVDLQTGYVYDKGENGYTFDNKFYANSYGYVQYLIGELKKQAADEKVSARYNVKNKTVAFTVEKADSLNKYLAPLLSAYKDEFTTVGALLDEYCDMFFGKTFDDIYGVIEEYAYDSENTLGSLVKILQDYDVDVEAILAKIGYELTEDKMAAVMARSLNKVVAGAYAYISKNWRSLIAIVGSSANGGANDSKENEAKQKIVKDLIDAMLFSEVTDTDIAASKSRLKYVLGMAKNFGVKTAVDMMYGYNMLPDDLYTVIKNGVKLKNATITLTLTIGDNNAIKGVKIDFYAVHSYKGEAAEDSYLADNNYRTTAEIVIDEYTAPTEDFVINFDPACDYKMPIVAYLYEVTDKDVSVYFETGGKPVTIRSYALYWKTPDGDSRQIFPENEDAFKFDPATSSFVFDNGLIQDTFSDAAFSSYVQAGFSMFGTRLEAVVVFDNDEGGYAITLMYANDDWQALKAFASGLAKDKVFEFVGGAGAGAPNI